MSYSSKDMFINKQYGRQTCQLILAFRLKHDLLAIFFLFIYMKLKNLEKQANYILNYIYKKKTREGTKIVSSNKRDSIQISYGVLGQLQI